MKRLFSSRFGRLRVLLLAPLLLSIAATGPLLALDVVFNEGVAAFQAKNFKAAASHFKASIQQSPEAYQGHCMLGLSLGAVGKKAEALHHLRKAYDLNPNDLSLKAAVDKLSNVSGKEMQRISAELGAGLIAERSKRASPSSWASN